MKKAFDQTVRDLKREVNKKVLKVPNIEQKILDATSNEPWGPHGSHLADIAQATRNYHEYQLIMTVIWKRVNDTGKNWRHVYKGLTVLEYLVAHGSERVIDEIREHAYQISTLSDFQYIDSKGRDQGINVRKKSQSLVSLVNDKERIQEVREKAAANREKYRSTYSADGMPRRGSFSGSGGGYGDQYDDDRYGSRNGSKDEDQYGNAKGRYEGYKDDDRSSRGGDMYSPDGEHNGRDHYRGDDYRGRNRNDDHQFGSRSRSVDGERTRSFDDEDRYSSRSGGGGRGDETSHDERHVEKKVSEQNTGAPPSYEEVTKDGKDSHDGRKSTLSSNPEAPVPSESTVSSHSEANNVSPAVHTGIPPRGNEVENFDEFDPRGFTSVAPPAANTVGMDFFGSFSAEDSLNSLALVPVTSPPTTSEFDMPTSSNFGDNFVALSSATSVFSQSNEDPFGNNPFRATPPIESQNSAPVAPTQTTFGSANISEQQAVMTASGIEFGESFLGITYTPYGIPNGQLDSAFPSLPTAQPSNGSYGNVLPQGGNAFPSDAVSLMPPARSQTAPPDFLVQSDLSSFQSSEATSINQSTQPGMMSQGAPPNPFGHPGISSQSGQVSLAPTGLPKQSSTPNLLGQLGLPASLHSQEIPVSLSSQAALTSLTSQSGPTLSGMTSNASQPQDKFEMKSTVWADTLSRGLVNLNISGPKANPLADIGVDFDSLNRKERREEKKSSSTPVSTITMGKAMGSGSGVGRAGATGFAPPLNPMARPGMGGYGVGMNQQMGMGGYPGGMNPAMGMGMGAGMGMGMGMNMGMGQGGMIRPGTGLPPNPGMPGVGYNPMMGMGGYGSQQSYGSGGGGGYR